MSGSYKQIGQIIGDILKRHVNPNAQLLDSRPAGGGCINQALIAALSDGSRWFVKLNAADKEDMFIAEAEGLRAIRASRSIRAPEPMGYGVCGGLSYLVLEYLPLKGRGDPQVAGAQLALMHRQCAESYGWFRDNTIGSTPQSNRQHAGWADFWRRERLEFQLKLARQNAYSGRAHEQGMRLAERVETFFTDYQPPPSLLHGDLWAGNLAYDPAGQPVIYDPAVYYGDREADIAMTELFGGFGADFYTAYQEHWPLDAGYKVRKTLYNLYHILNHYNLFGGGYAAQAERMTARLLAEC